jgi:hypothetical protein
MCKRLRSIFWGPVLRTPETAGHKATTAPVDATLLSGVLEVNPALALAQAEDREQEQEQEQDEWQQSP